MAVAAVPSGDLTVDVEGAVVTMTINRAAKRNAFTQAMYALAAETLEAADSDGGVGAVVITGAGQAFTAGNDLDDFTSGVPLHQVTRFLDALASARVPLVAAVNGVAVGVGVTMLLHCDLVYVEPDAALAAPFVNLGLVPEAGSSLLLPQVVGRTRAAELLLTGRRFSGAEAAEWGLANAAVTPVLPAALAAAAALAAQPPEALRRTKALLHSAEQSVEGRMREEMAQFVESLAGPEFKEVMAARVEGRAPRFRR